MPHEQIAPVKRLGVQTPSKAQGRPIRSSSPLWVLGVAPRTPPPPWGGAGAPPPPPHNAADQQKCVQHLSCVPLQPCGLSGHARQ
jgi:hypothetical protein